jgi:hypothetical protein
MVWAYTPLPRPIIQFNPSTVGLTQLPTLFWASGVNQNVDARVELEGYALTVGARPTEFLWNFGDGARAESAGPGDPGDPAVEHTYTEAGTYRVVLTVVYSGSFSYSGPSGQGGESLADYAAGPYAEAYTVQQVRSVLVMPQAP